MYYVPQPAQVPERLHHSRWVADLSIDFLRGRDPDRPFLLCAHFVRPHPPFESPAPWNKLYRGDEVQDPFLPPQPERVLTYWNAAQNRYKWRDGGADRHLLRTMRAAYFASISFLDAQVGRILDALGEDLDDTLVLFSSDHGEMLGDFGCFGKRCMLAPSLRVPMLVRWPGRVPAGRTCDRVTTLLDVFPTVCDAAGVDDGRPSPEGRSLLDVAAGRGDRDTVFSQFQRDGFGLHAAVTRGAKLIRTEPDQRTIAFDLDADPRETTPLPANHPLGVELENRLIRRYRVHAYAAPLSEDQHGWRTFPRRSVPADPDAGLLRQDVPGLAARLAALGPGYARPACATATDSLLRPHDPSPDLQA